MSYLGRRQVLDYNSKNKRKKLGKKVGQGEKEGKSRKGDSPDNEKIKNTEE